MYNQNNAFEDMEKQITNSSMSDQEKVRMLENLHNARNQEINLMITGATGCGKSSTINALFQSEVSAIGQGAEPETMEISKYEYNNLIIWDTPGLGDGIEKDKVHANKIISKLNEKDSSGNALIDLVLVIIDGKSLRDLTTTCHLINDVIIPNLGERKEKRLLVAINKCDAADDGDGWDRSNNCPEKELIELLDDYVQVIRKRINESTGLDITPIYYSAGRKKGDNPQNPSYNLTKLLYNILIHTPPKKRLVYANNLSQNPEAWESNDNRMDYGKECKKSFASTLFDGIEEGAERGEEIGEMLFGKVGGFFGKGLGAVTGGAGAIVDKAVETIERIGAPIKDWFKSLLPF